VRLFNFSFPSISSKGGWKLSQGVLCRKVLNLYEVTSLRSKLKAALPFKPQVKLCEWMFAVNSGAVIVLTVVTGCDVMLS
jgi:hypothetical protein